jgi:hypothetical protein
MEKKGVGQEGMEKCLGIGHSPDRAVDLVAAAVVSSSSISSNPILTPYFIG